MKSAKGDDYKLTGNLLGSPITGFCEYDMEHSATLLTGDASVRSLQNTETSNSQSPLITSTPRRNPKRSCLGKPYWKHIDEIDFRTENKGNKINSDTEVLYTPSRKYHGKSSQSVKEVSVLLLDCVDRQLTSSTVVSNSYQTVRRYSLFEPRKRHDSEEICYDESREIEYKPQKLAECTRKFFETCTNNFKSHDTESTSGVSTSASATKINVAALPVLSGSAERKVAKAQELKDEKSVTKNLLVPSEKVCGGYKNSVEDYDPENDAFVHGQMSHHFDTVSLRKDIKRFLDSSDLPKFDFPINNTKSDNTKRKYKKSSVAAHKTPENEDLKQKPKKRSSKKDSDDDDDDIFEKVGDDWMLAPPPAPVYKTKPTSEETLRALLNARLCLLRIAERRRCYEEVLRAQREGKRTPYFALGIAFAGTNKVLAPSRPNEQEILKDVVVFVDVISQFDEDVSSVVQKELMKLGATVVPTFTKDMPVTHVVFNDGHVSTYRKAVKRGIPLVSVLWIEECRRKGKKVCVSEFPPYKMERYEMPNFVRKIKKRKFLYFNFAERVPKRRKRSKPKPPERAPTPPPPPPPPELSRLKECTPEWVKTLAGNHGRIQILVNMTGIREEEFRKMLDEPDNSDSYEASPLPIRLLYRYSRDVLKSRNGTPSTNVTSASDSSEEISEHDIISKCAESSSPASHTLTGGAENEMKSSPEDEEETRSDHHEMQSSHSLDMDAEAALENRTVAYTSSQKEGGSRDHYPSRRKLEFKDDIADEINEKSAANFENNS